MPDYIATQEELTSIADAIRTKGGTTAPLAFPAEFIAAIAAIKTGGVCSLFPQQRAKLNPKARQILHLRLLAILPSEQSASVDIRLMQRGMWITKN